MIILLASDHAGFELKRYLGETLRSWGYDVQDMGPQEYHPLDDYPELIAPAVRAVSKDPEHLRAIVIGGSGQGEAIVANRFPGVRAVVYYGGDLEVIRLSREHNDANVLSLGARFLSPDGAAEAVRLWLTEPFSGDERHRRRNVMIEQREIIEPT